MNSVHFKYTNIQHKYDATVEIYRLSDIYIYVCIQYIRLKDVTEWRPDSQWLYIGERYHSQLAPSLQPQGTSFVVLLQGFLQTLYLDRPTSSLSLLLHLIILKLG